MGRVILLVFVAGMVWGQGSVKFMGRVVTVTQPGYEDAEHMFPKGPAIVCVEGPPRRQCYTPPKEFGGNPEVRVILLDKTTSAIFFSAGSGGVSGWGIHFALLRPGNGDKLDNLFPTDLTISNQSEHIWWSDVSISDSKIFVAATYIWGPDDSHYGPHRYTVSSYVCREGAILGYGCYLDDQYMTARGYDGEKQKILDSEKSEIIARLKRVKQQSPRQK
jgi:hypothetical protein